MTLVIYRKSVNDFLYFKIVSSYYTFYKVGSQNGYGWLIVSVQCYFENRFYNIDNYRKLLDNFKDKIYLKQKRKEKIVNILKSIFDLTS